MAILPFPWLLLVLVGYTGLGWQLAGWPLSPNATLMVALGLAVALPWFIAFLKWLGSLFLVTMVAAILSALVWPLLGVFWELAVLWLVLMALLVSLKLVTKTVRKISFALVLMGTASTGLSLGLVGRFALQWVEALWLLWQLG
ncbi:MAG: hypothetical protein HC918_01175 [Oscillatoriales cyanobacterium SM2_1_8]|nr:hypothetical protein [Oscillatoriales cyanobacterium SM2_1_8]